MARRIGSSGVARQLAAALVLTSTLAAGQPQAPPIAVPPLARAGTIVLATEQPREAARAIQDAARLAGGRVEHGTDTELVVVIPNAGYPSFVRGVASLGVLRSERVRTDDLTEALTSMDASVDAARATRNRLERLGSDGSPFSVAERLQLAQQLERAANEITAAEARQRELRRRASTTRVVVRLQVPPRETIPAPKLPFGWLDQLGPQFLNDLAPPPPTLHRELRAFVDVASSMRAGWSPAPETLDGRSAFWAFTVPTRVLGEANPVGLFGGFDLALGGGGGFLYGVQSLFGVGMPLGSRVALGLTSGPGLDGVTTVVPFGVDVPIELYLMVDAARWVSVSAWIQDGWVLAADAREKGSQTAPFGDELSAGLALSFGSREALGTYTEARSGPRFGVGYRELMGTRLYELTIGWAFHHADFSEGP